MNFSIGRGSLIGLILLLLVTPSRAAIIGLQRVASGLSSPMFATHAPGDTSRLFIAERGGAIKILNLATNTIEATPFLTIPGVDQEGEGGLLGLAFHPDYQTNGKFYVDVTTDNGGDTSLGVTSPFSVRIREYTVTANPNVASLASQRELLSIVKPQSNHNGGWIGFSPKDNFFYIAVGDGGGGDDNGGGHTAGTGNAQDITNNLLGKMLRINVNGDDFPADANRNYAIPATNPMRAGVGNPADDVGDDEIWAYGLRNPFRNSFDRSFGDLWIGDVGQSAREEINRQSFQSTGGENYGWRLREGKIQNPTAGIGGPAPAGAIDPVYDYNRNADQFGGTVVTGGYVYRGPDQNVQGQYLFLDSRNSASAADDNYWMLNALNLTQPVQNIDSLLTPDVGSPQFPVSFGEDARGNLYIVYLVSGDVYRIRTSIVPEPASVALALGGALMWVFARRRPN